jgi:hypothetical protein
LLAHSDPADRIFVWGQTPEIYLDAQRRPACRYITTFPLTGYVFGGPILGFDTRSGSCPAHGTPSSRTLPGIRPTTLSIFTPSVTHFIQCKIFRSWQNY